MFRGKIEFESLGRITAAELLCLDKEPPGSSEPLLPQCFLALRASGHPFDRRGGTPRCHQQYKSGQQRDGATAAAYAMAMAGCEKRLGSRGEGIGGEGARGGGRPVQFPQIVGGPAVLLPCLGGLSGGGLEP